MPGQAPILFGRCQVDVPGRTLLRGGEPVPVQPRVFDLLVYLIEHRDRVVSGEELLDTLWRRVAVTPNSLSRAIHKARIAVGDDGNGQSAIATVRGRGFRFVARLRGEQREQPEDASPELVGRDRELERLEASLERARAGRGGLVLLAGEPGIGKTRLARELVSRALGGGALALLARCPESSDTPPYWPWRQIAWGLARGRTPAELTLLAGRYFADFARIDPVLARAVELEPLPALPPEEMRLRLFDAAVDALGRLARERPLVLALDDLHIADPPSLAFLRFLSYSVAEIPLLLIGTLRDEELAGGTPRRRLLADTERSAGGETVRLGPLDEFAVRRLSEKRLGRPLAEEALKALCTLSGGNPFFVEELLCLARQRGVEVLAPGAAVGLRLPATVRGAIELQLGGLGPGEREMLAVAAVLGDEVEPGVLARATGATAEGVSHALGAAEDARVLERDGGGRFRFRHALLREALYEDLGASERARTHQRVARVLEDEPDADPSALAFHWNRALPAGGADRALDFACRAAQVCRSQLAFEKAARHLEQALEALGHLPAEPSRRRCDLLIEAAQAFGHSDLGRATQLLLEALRFARKLPPAEFGGLLPAIATVAADFRLAPQELQDSIKEALASPHMGDATARAALLAAAGRGCLRGDRSARDLSRRAVELARASGDRPVLARALCSWHWLHGSPEYRAERWEAVQEIERLGTEAGHQTLLRGRYLRAIDALEMADRAQVLAAVRGLDQGARETADPLARWRALLCRSMLATVECRFGLADRLSGEALAQGRRQPLREFDAEIAYRSQQNRSAFLRHEVEALGEGLRSSAERAPGLPILELSLASWHVELRDLDGARSCLDRCAREDLLGEPDDVVILHMLATVCSELRDQPLCEAVRARLLPYRGLQLLQPEIFCFFGPADRYLALLSRALEDLDLADELFRDAAASCASLEAAAELLLVRTDHARMLAERGRRADRRAARDQLDLARAVATRLRIPGVLRRLDSVRSGLGI
jgi:DNA-binding winged helix-turn-helix (wHTH) protein